jgi:hypothetical protein
MVNVLKMGRRDRQTLVGLALMCVWLGACAGQPAAPSSGTTAELPRTLNIGDVNDTPVPFVARLRSPVDGDRILGTLEVLLKPSAIGDPHIFQATGQVRLQKLDLPYTFGEIADSTGAVIFSYDDPGERGGEVFFPINSTVLAADANHMILVPTDFRANVYTASGLAAFGVLQFGSPFEKLPR